MVEMAMAFPLSNYEPVVILEFSDHFTNLYHHPPVVDRSVF
jgi:hypothetical protein